MNSPPLSESMPRMGKGNEGVACLIAATQNASLLPMKAAQMVHPVATSVIVSVLMYSPRALPPQWATRSISRKPGMSSFQSANVRMGIWCLRQLAVTSCLRPVPRMPPGLIAKTSDINAKDNLAVYDKVNSGIKDALRILGITSDFNEGDEKNCPNLTVKGKKISGSAQIRKRDTILQHGTLLLDVDMEKMFTVIRVPWAKTCMEVINVAKNRITSVKNELGHAVSAETAANALAVGFKNALTLQPAEGELTNYEMELAQKLCKEKYATDDWNLHGKSIIF